MLIFLDVVPLTETGNRTFAGCFVPGRDHSVTVAVIDAPEQQVQLSSGLLLIVKLYEKLTGLQVHPPAGDALIRHEIDGLVI
jgi:hypothetical protein